MGRPLTITVEQAADLLGISRTSAYLCAARGEIPTRRLGRRVLVLYDPLLAMFGATPDHPPQLDLEVRPPNRSAS